MNSSPRRALRPLLWVLLTAFGLAFAWNAGAVPMRHAPRQSRQVAAVGRRLTTRVVAAQSVASARPASPGRTRGGLQSMAAGAPPTAIPLYTFPGKPGGAYPQARLTPGSDGNFYGVTLDGGNSDFGTAFRMSPNGTVTQLASFGTNSSIGRHPAGPLVEGLNPNGTPNGSFYGVTTDGGDNAKGTVYLFAPDAGSPTGYSITTLYSFTGGADGGAPSGGLTLGRKADGTPDGYLYGATSQGGNSDSVDTSGSGVIFRISPGGAEDTLYAFPLTDNFGINQGGSSPNGGLVQRQSTGRGDLLGTAYSGGTRGKGTVFDLTPAGQLVTLHDFQPTNSDGQRPKAGLTQDGAGLYFGTTFVGGPQGQAGSGTVFEILADANSATGFSYFPYVWLGADNAGPTDSLLLAADGRLYGTSSFGGGQYGGTVFVLASDQNAPTGNVAKPLYTFNNSAKEGSYILAGVTQGTDGDLYGVATTSGSATFGTAFRLNVGAGGKAPAPTITSVEYYDNLDGTSSFFVNGTGFVNSSQGLSITNVRQGTGVVKTVPQRTQVKGDLTSTLPPGDHTVTVTNPDGQSATGTLTTLDAPAVEGTTAVTDTDGSVHLVVTGINFGTAGYDTYPDGSEFLVFDSSGNAVDVTASVRPALPSPAAGDQQAILTLNGAGDGSDYRVVVVNADHQHSPFSAPASSARSRRTGAASLAAGPLVPDTSAFNVYTQDATQYSVQATKIINSGASFETIFRLTGWHPPLLAPPGQILVGQVSFIDTAQSTNVLAAGLGTSLTGLISQDGAGLISQDGAGIVSQDSGGIVSQDSGGIGSHDSGGVISNDGGSYIPKGSSLVASGGGNALPVSSLLGPVANGSNLTGSLSLVASGGGNIVASGGGNFAPRSSARSVRPQAQQGGTPLSFILTHHDEGSAKGTASTDGTVSVGDSGGNETPLLDIRYTPGQPDVIVYKAPGVTVTPRNGTPAPQVLNPTPTLAQLNPNVATAGGGDFTLTAIGTLFTDGAIVNWNGQPLATTVVSGTTLTARVPAAFTAAPGTARVTVTNPAPAGGTSNAVPFTVNSSAPPVTTPALTGPSYANGFWRGPVTVTLSAAPGSAPVAGTFYSVDSGPLRTYAGPFTVTGDFDHLVTFYSVDRAGNAEGPARSVTFSIDGTPPVTTITSRAVDGGREVTLTDRDNFSGPGGTFFRVDSGPQRTYAGPFTVTGAGRHLVTAYSVDRALNAETTPASLTFAIAPPPPPADTAPPVTTPALSGPSYANGFWRGPVTVTLAATDSQSGVANTFFRVDSGPLRTYAGPFVVTGDFAHLVTFYSVDDAGNAEGPAKSVTFKIDSTPPVTSASPSGVRAARGAFRRSVSVTLTATDDFSGPGGTFFRVDSGPQQTYAGPFVVTGVGQHLVTFFSVDRAGNAEGPARSATFTVTR